MVRLRRNRRHEFEDGLEKPKRNKTPSGSILKWVDRETRYFLISPSFILRVQASPMSSID